MELFKLKAGNSRMSIKSIGGLIGAKSAGSDRGLISWLRGTQMLKINEKLPSGVMMPTSPIRIPSIWYRTGRFRFGAGTQSANPTLCGNKWFA